MQVRFLAVPGSYKGQTFPPGTGNVDAIVPTVSSLSGTSATVMTTTVSEGADEMGGGFALSFAGEVTETLLYTADETSVEAVLEVRGQRSLRSNEVVVPRSPTQTCLAISTNKPCFFLVTDILNYVYHQTTFCFRYGVRGGRISVYRQTCHVLPLIVHTYPSGHSYTPSI